MAALAAPTVRHSYLRIVHQPDPDLVAALRDWFAGTGPPAKPAPYLKTAIEDAATGSSPADQLATLFPVLRAESAVCPVCSLNQEARWDHGRTWVVPHPIANVIIHLNDQHAWPREQTAGWLETLPVDLTIQPTAQGD